MIDLSNFFKNHFDTARISDSNFNSFTQDHLQRLTKSGKHPALVAVLTSVYTLWSGATLDEATHTALREGLTKAMNDAFNALKKAISQQEGAVRAKYGTAGSAYQEFYPQGITEYSNMKLGEVDVKVGRWIKAATAHSADLPGLAVAMTTLLTNFDTVRNNQLGGKGDVSTSKATSTSTRDDVEKQLMVNLLTIAIDHIGDPQGGLAFFDQTTIKPAPVVIKPPATPTNNPAK